MTLKSLLVKGAMAGLAVGTIVAVATPASADVACNRWGECWHVRDRTVTYPPNVGVTFYDDAWARAHRHGHWHWRKDRDDRGYYSHGRWHPL